MYRNIIIVLILIAGMTGFLYSSSVFIWDNDNSGDFPNPDSGEIIGTEFALQKALEDNGRQYDIGWVLPDDLASYDILFIPLGKYCFG
jgi:hypothetical protein